MDPRREPGGGRIPSKAHATELQPDSAVGGTACGGTAAHRSLVPTRQEPRERALMRPLGARRNVGQMWGAQGPLRCITRWDGRACRDRGRYREVADAPCVQHLRRAGRACAGAFGAMTPAPGTGRTPRTDRGGIDGVSRGHNSDLRNLSGGRGNGATIECRHGHMDALAAGEVKSLWTTNRRGAA